MSEKDLAAQPPPYQPSVFGGVANDAVQDMLAQLQTWVTLDQCKAHLRLLLHFSNLHQTYAARAELDHLAFLCTAERRYTDWMHGLAAAIGRHQEVVLVTNPPIPPLDVALFWAAHLLSPIRYMDDMSRVFPNVPQMHQIPFPMQALAAHADDGLVNAESEQFWIKYVSATEPYASRLPSYSGNDGPSTEHAPPAINVSFTCPYCKVTRTFTDATLYVPFRLNGQSLFCINCHESVSVMQTATARLLDDIVAFRAHPETHRLPGSHIDPITRLFHPNVNRDHLKAMLVTHASEWDALLHVYTRLRAHPVNVQRAALHFDELLKPSNSPVFYTHDRALRNQPELPKRNVYARLIGSYQNIPVGPWSLDLVQAVLRQRDFTDKMAHGAVQEQADQFAMRAQARYRNFLLLVRDHPSMFVVPTLDIDLAWHTHQLLGSKYVEFTQRLTGSVVNHDDAVPKGTLRTGVHDTAVLWHKKFGEPYACDAKYHKYWTADRVGNALLLPPLLGPIEMMNARKHKKAINDAGGCAFYPPSETPLQHKKAYTSFVSSSKPSASSSSSPSLARALGDPTKSSRLLPHQVPIPFLTFYSGCAPDGTSGGQFSERRVDTLIRSGGVLPAGCGTVAGAGCGTGGGCGGSSAGCGGGGGGCGGGGCGGGGCGGGG